MFKNHQVIVAQGLTFFSRCNARQRLLIQVALLVAVGMLVVVPKTMTGAFTGTQFVGWMPLWELPAAAQAARSAEAFWGAKLVSVQIDLGRLALQFIALGVISFFAFRFLGQPGTPER